MIVGAASGSYDFTHLTAALRNEYIDASPSDYTMDSNGLPRTPRDETNLHNNRQIRPASTPIPHTVR